MIKLKQAVIVEGKYDKIKLSNIVDAPIICTDGFGIFKDKELRNLIKALAERNGIIVLTDSDSAGFKIRNFISSFVDKKYITNAYIPDIFGREKRKTEPSKEGKLGVEGVSESVIKDALKKDLTVKDIEEFESSLRTNDKVLYLVDNTGEIVFDKLLLSKIREYGLDITIAVKSEPILNDACMAEALDAGLDEYGEIVEIGCGTVGYVDSEISDEFREIFNDHKFIISKGMGNYEGLTEIDLSDKDIYFLLCAKCNTISRDIGVNLHDMLLFKK